MTKYVNVEWPDYQYFMEHERWGECLATDLDKATCSYMVPEDLYDEVFQIPKFVNIYIKPDNSLVTGQNVYTSKESAQAAENIPYPGCRYYGPASVRSVKLQQAYGKLNDKK